MTATAPHPRPRAAGGVKALPRHEEGEPGGGEAQEGIGSERRLNPVSTTTDFHTEQSPEGGAIERGTGGEVAASAAKELLVAFDRQRREGHGHRRGGTAVWTGKPLKGEPWTRQWGETNPQGRWRMKPSRA
jgi:hypothetical protein